MDNEATAMERCTDALDIISGTGRILLKIIQEQEFISEPKAKDNCYALIQMILYYSDVAKAQ